MGNLIGHVRNIDLCEGDAYCLENNRKKEYELKELKSPVTGEFVASPKRAACTREGLEATVDVKL